ncbi:MAG: protein jag [Anaerolineaceae bacterium]|nr:protein jag [Anaerolineaceae bacterium]
MTIIEIIAPTVEEAIEKGLLDLGLKEGDVEVEILDEGKHGLFKLASRQARVRLKVINSDNEIHGAKPIEDKGREEVPDVETENWLDSEPETDDALQMAHNTVSDLLDKMGVNAEVQVEFGPEDDRNIAPILVNIEGNDLSFLIGRKSETINALQYIANLIVNKKLNKWIPLQIDVQNYRQRRERELSKLAKKIGEQVLSTGRQQSLEPMPPNERRIIHIALRENEELITESIGEDPYRKVTIALKE